MVIGGENRGGERVTTFDTPLGSRLIVRAAPMLTHEMARRQRPDRLSHGLLQQENAAPKRLKLEDPATA
jgi:hypothetical protein